MIEHKEDGSTVGHPWAIFGTKIIEKDGRYLNQVTHAWVEEGHDPPKRWDNKHWMTCTHRSGNFVVIREAEQVCVFDEVEKNRIHISVTAKSDEVGQWFQCKTISSATWHAMTEGQLMMFVSEELQNLKQIAGIK